jgi:hypothetical protein
MLAKAGVTPTESRVRVGDPKLAEVTGARQPSGVPVPPRQYKTEPIKQRRPGQGPRRHGAPKNRPPRYRHTESATADKR